MCTWTWRTSSSIDLRAPFKDTGRSSLFAFGRRSIRQLLLHWIIFGALSAFVCPFAIRSNISFRRSGPIRVTNRGFSLTLFSSLGSSFCVAWKKFTSRFHVRYTTRESSDTVARCKQIKCVSPRERYQLKLASTASCLHANWEFPISSTEKVAEDVSDNYLGISLATCITFYLSTAIVKGKKRSTIYASVRYWTT